VRGFGELEAAIMNRAWDWARPVTVREIVDDINRERPIAYTTVMTVTEILCTKGWLVRDGKSGRAWVYRAARSREEYTSGLMREALGETPDRTAALLHFVEQLPAEEAAILRQALGRKEGR
jgi:predicted transcriptional regulator